MNAGPYAAAMIKISYDPQSDALFVWLAPESIQSADTREVAPGIMLDFDAEGRVIGIEVLDVRERVIAYPEPVAA